MFEVEEKNYSNFTSIDAFDHSLMNCQSYLFGFIFLFFFSHSRGTTLVGERVSYIYLQVIKYIFMNVLVVSLVLILD